MGWFLSYIYYIYLFVLGISAITLQFFLYLYKPPVFINDLSHLSQDLLRFNIRLFYLSNAPESSTSTNLIFLCGIFKTLYIDRLDLVTQENLCYNLKCIFKHRIYLEIFQVFFFLKKLPNCVVWEKWISKKEFLGGGQTHLGGNPNCQGGGA